MDTKPKKLYEKFFAIVPRHVALIFFSVVIMFGVALNHFTHIFDATLPTTYASGDSPMSRAEARKRPHPPGFYNVVHVVDGDTVVIDEDGIDTTIRLLGINTPETVDPRRPVQCYGHEASAEAKKLLSDTYIKLEMDPHGDAKDVYGRTLGYVFMADGTNFNLHMIADGYAYEYTFKGRHYKYQAAFKAAQKEAKAQHRGLWSPATCNGKKTAV